MNPHSNLLILGLGLSSACLILNLRQFGFAGKITVLEKNARPQPNKRWCTWGPLPEPLKPVPTVRWERCTLSLQGDAAEVRSSQQPYTQLHARDLWQHFFQLAENDPGTEIHFETNADPHNDVEKTRLRIRYKSSLILDSTPPPLPANSYQQQFAGYTIRSKTNLFDPATAGLMHFQPHGPDNEIHFTYCLPYEADRALIEYTAFRSGAFDLDRMQGRLERALKDQFDLSSGGYYIEEKESGCLPMEPPPAKPSEPGYWPMGLASGAIRASSGYALLKIADQADSYAKSILESRPQPKHHTHSALEKFMDRCFLKVLQRDARVGEQALFSAAKNTKSDDFIRFMRNEITLTGALKMAWAMPKRKFISTLLG